jgi:hypothetical protein
MATTGVQRQPPVVVTSWVHAGWYKAVIDSPGSDTTTTTAIEGAAVIQRGRSPSANWLLGGSSALTLGVQSILKGSAPVKFDQFGVNLLAA